MIANNYRRYADALIRQIELDLSGTVGASTQQRSAWWQWLMSAGQPQPIAQPTVPARWNALKLASRRLAQQVKAALFQLFAQE